MQRLLLDTHVLLDIVRRGLTAGAAPLDRLLAEDDVAAFASTASLWEIAIKTRLGKLDPGMPLDALADYLESLHLTILDIDREHAVAMVEPEPATRDPSTACFWRSALWRRCAWSPSIAGSRVTGSPGSRPRADVPVAPLCRA